jgi:hypothetical protein
VDNSSTYSSATELYDGISWANDTVSMSTAREHLEGAGTHNSCSFSIWWFPPGYIAATEEYTGAGSPTTVTITAS